MLSELRVRQLGVIEDLTLLLGPGLTALTGETGAGKTLVVEAIQLLLGARADGMLVRPGAAEAIVEGRFEPEPGRATGHQGQQEDQEEDQQESEVVLSRVVPGDGRSRAYIDGRMATAAALAQLGGGLVDLHGQHAHQSLFAPAAQRGALDTFAGVNTASRDLAKADVRRVEALMAEAGGDGSAQEREMDFLRYQLAELTAAAISGPDEDTALSQEEEDLGGASAHRAAAETAYEGLAGEDQVIDRLGRVAAAVAGHPLLASVYQRLREASADLADVAAEARSAADQLEDDPGRLAEVVRRRGQLSDLRRKYAGPGGRLEQVLAFESAAQRRLSELEELQHSASGLGLHHAEAMARLNSASVELGVARRQAAADLGRAVELELRALAMPRARFDVEVGQGGDELRALSGDDVTFLLAANPGEPLLPLAKVASGGELARAMLALRLVLLGVPQPAGPDQSSRGAQGPSTLIFDEVDAGIGGEAAVAVGRALADLGRRYQVIVVTHLAQVAAFAHAQVAVSKADHGERTAAGATVVEGADRVVELSRMLSGRPDSQTARRHAEELLRTATASSGDAVSTNEASAVS